MHSYVSHSSYRPCERKNKKTWLKSYRCAVLSPSVVHWGMSYALLLCLIYMGPMMAAKGSYILKGLYLCFLISFWWSCYRQSRRRAPLVDNVLSTVLIVDIWRPQNLHFVQNLLSLLPRTMGDYNHNTCYRCHMLTRLANGTRSVHQLSSNACYPKPDPKPQWVNLSKV